MLADSIMRLKLAFAGVPMNGLFFWESLLSFDDEGYKGMVEENFMNIINSLSEEDGELKVYCMEILNDLKKMRKGVIEFPKIREEIEKIREELIEDAAQEAFIGILNDSLAKQEVNKTK